MVKQAILNEKGGEKKLNTGQVLSALYQIINAQGHVA